MKRPVNDGAQRMGCSRSRGAALSGGVSIPCFSKPWLLRPRELLLLLATFCMASCSSVEPRPPKIDAAYLTNYAPERKSISITNVDQARALLDGYRAVLEDAATGRLTREDVINELTFYGTLVAVIGIAAKSIAARNVGAGVAGISTIVGGHYKFDKQSQSFVTAYNRTTCVLTALNGIDLKTDALFDGKSLDEVAGKGLDDAYAQIPNETMGAIQSINTLLQADLANISLASGSLSDIQKTAASVTTAAQSAKDIKLQEASEKTEAEFKKSNDDLTEFTGQKMPDQIDKQLDAKKITAYIRGYSAVTGTSIDAATAKKMMLAQAVAAVNAEVAASQKAADDAAIAKAAESAKKTVFLKSIAQFAAASAACTKPSP